MNKQEFIKIVNGIKTQVEKDRKFASAINEFIDGSTGLYDNSAVFEALFLTLRIHVGDQGLDWIEYWMWELDFGAKWKKGSVTDNGKDIKLKTVEDLFNLVQSNNPEILKK